MTARGGAVPASIAWRPLFTHLRLHYQLLFLSPLFAWGFLLGGATPSWRALLGFLSFHVCLYGGITAYNSYYDRDEGPVGGLKVPPPVTEPLLGFSLSIQALGFVLAGWVSTAFGLLYLLVMVLSVAYSHPRFRWKARPVLSLFVVALGQGAVGFAGGWLCGADPPRPFYPPLDGALGMAGAALITTGFYPLTQLYQIEEDRTRGDRTFAVAFGARASFRFSLTLLLLGGACLLPVVHNRFGAWDAALFASAFLALLAAIAVWGQRFAQHVDQNFRTLHRLQAAMSLGILGYIGLRLWVS